MNTLEDRLRAALTAKSDGVAFAMLTRTLPTFEADPEPDAPVMLLPTPLQRPRRSRRIIATAVAVAAGLLIAVGAVILHQATSHQFDPAHVRPRTAIPWDEVGPGWTLVQEASRTRIPYYDRPDPYYSGWLQLLDPSGDRYQITFIGDSSWWLQSWDGQHRRAMLLSHNSGEAGMDRILLVDLVDNNQNAFPIRAFGQPPSFSSDGQSVIYVDDAQRVERYSLTGEPQQPAQPIPSSELVADSPDGTQAIVDGHSGLDAYDWASGQRVGSLPPPTGYAGCFDPQWDAAGKLIANCRRADDRTKTGTFVFSAGGLPTAGRADPQYAVAGNRLTAFRQGVVATTYPGDPQHQTADSFPALTGLTAARLDAAGHTVSIPVPPQIRAPGWVIANSNADVFTVVKLWGSTIGLSTEAVSWNPFTGQVSQLIQAGMPSEAFVEVLPWGARQY